jgi:hypothetical protein
MGRRLIRSQEVGSGVVGSRRVQLAAAVGSVSVVVGLVLGRDYPQVPLAEDEHPVGDLGSGIEHEPLGEGRRGGVFTASIPALARTASNESVNCPARSRIRNRKSAARSPRAIRRLRICCVVHGPSGAR